MPPGACLLDSMITALQKDRVTKGRNVNHLPNVAAARRTFLEEVHELADGLLQSVGSLVIPRTPDSHDLVQLYVRVTRSLGSCSTARFFNATGWRCGLARSEKDILFRMQFRKVGVGSLERAWS